MPVYVTVTAPSGGDYRATLERLSDGYYREDDAETFGSGLAFADKDILLTEGSDENRGTYSKTFDASAWSDGMYRVRVHDLNDNNNVVTSDQFSVLAGEEVSVGEETPIYHADIQFIRNTSSARDEYMVTWFKNGQKQTSVTNPGIKVTQQDGTGLIPSGTLTDRGQGIYTYTATNSQLQSLGNLYHVDASGKIDSSYRQYTWNLGRDSA